MQEQYFPNPPIVFRNASDIVNKCKSGVSRTRRLAIAFHLLCTYLYRMNSDNQDGFRARQPNVLPESEASIIGHRTDFEEKEKRTYSKPPFGRLVIVRWKTYKCFDHCPRWGTAWFEKIEFIRETGSDNECTKVGFGTFEIGPSSDQIDSLNRF